MVTGSREQLACCPATELAAWLNLCYIHGDRIGDPLAPWEGRCVMAKAKLHTPASPKSGSTRASAGNRVVRAIGARATQAKVAEKSVSAASSDAVRFVVPGVIREKRSHQELDALRRDLGVSTKRAVKRDARANASR